MVWLDLHRLLITALLACFTVGHSAHKHYHSLHVECYQEAHTSDKGSRGTNLVIW